MLKALFFRSLAVSLVLFYLFSGCENSIGPEAITNSIEQEIAGYKSVPLNLSTAIPSDLVTVTFGGSSLEFWPYTGSNFSGTPQDPVNLIFFGEADPLDIRAALLSLDGDRSSMGLPPLAPFNSRWDDAIGDVQSGYSSESGWVGGVVQLACGDYREARFHLRLFKMGQWTIGNAHFEALITGTTDHQVVSWEMAEEFIIGDFIRSGLLDPDVPMVPTAQINDSPFRTIPAMIYNYLPDELIFMIGGPDKPVDDDVPISTDGHAMILNLADKEDRVYEERVQDFVIDFAQMIPRPFCATSEYDFIYVEGPVNLTQVTTLTEDGNYVSQFHAGGQLTATPINPETGGFIGETGEVMVKEHHLARIVGNNYGAAGWIFQRMKATDDAEASRKFVHIKINSNGETGFKEVIECGSD